MPGITHSLVVVASDFFGVPVIVEVEPPGEGTERTEPKPRPLAHTSNSYRGQVHGTDKARVEVGRVWTFLRPLGAFNVAAPIVDGSVFNALTFRVGWQPRET